MSRTVRVTTDLPISADLAFSLAHEPAMFEHVVRPVIRIGAGDLRRALATAETGFSTGDSFNGRLWFFFVIPAWRHTIEIVSDGPAADGRLELYTNERGGPIHTWNHRLAFLSTGESSCRYTDEIQIDAPAPVRAATVLFIKVFFRYRQWRWRRLTRGGNEALRSRSSRIPARD